MIESRLEHYANNEQGGLFINYNPDTINTLLEAAGSPHKSFPCIHISGTNGKGTTSWIIAGILQNSGYRTGLYTSPHLRSINERIRINNIPVEDREFIKILDKTEEIILANRLCKPTYFDILTAVAFIYFAQKQVDIAVIETGLGGRLDSTNVIDPLLSVITDISYDHTAVLGDTIEKIAREKCGIIKKGRPVITSNNPGSGLDIIKNYALGCKAELFSINNDFRIYNIHPSRNGINFSCLFKNYDLTGLFTPLLPVHQAVNCALAVTAALLLGERGYRNITPGIITETLQNIQVPGRYEKICVSPELIYDPAHNLSGITNLVSHLETYYKAGELVIILSLMNDKAIPELLDILSSLKFPVIYYQLDDPRAFIPEPGLFYLTTCKADVILQHIRADNTNRSYIFTGTFRNYTAASEIAAALCSSIKNSDKGEMR